MERQPNRALVSHWRAAACRHSPRLYQHHVLKTFTITMEAIMQSRLDRVETALNTLIDSIASYIPSTNAASDLLEADDELNESVDQCKLLIVN